MSLRIRRCRHLLIEPRERVALDLAALLNGGDSLVAEQAWIALAAHLDEEVELDPAELAALGAAPLQAWTDGTAFSATHGEGVVERLLDSGLLLSEPPRREEANRRDTELRELHWWTPAAVTHARSRWSGVDAERGDNGAPGSVEAMIERFGAPPPELVSLREPAQRTPLPMPSASALSDLLSRRMSCRNFDAATALGLDDLGGILHRVFGVQGRHELAPGAVALKKGSPSGGGLHPLEAYLLVQRVDGIAPGLYHYHAGDHALEPMGRPDHGVALASAFVAGQPWFADAPVLVAICARFWRHQWKYRNHPKAYRVLHLEAGHFSQTLFLAAAERDLGAFITAAINEHAVEQAFGLSPGADGPLAVCGFGARAARMETFELDPNHRVWPEGSGAA